MQRKKQAHRTFFDVFGRVTLADFSSWYAFRRSPFLNWLAFAFLCVAITLLMTFSKSNIPKEIATGAIAQHDIRADRNYEIVDEDATQKFIDEAVSGVLSVYDYDRELGQQIAEGNVGKPFEQAINTQILSAMGRPIILDAQPLAAEKAKGIVLRESPGKERVLGAKEISGILSIDEAKKMVRDGKFLGKKMPKATAVLASELIQPNVTFNMQEMQTRKDAATGSVRSVIIKIEAGETIIRAGSRYEPRHVAILKGMMKENEKTSAPFKVFGTLLLVALAIASAYYFAERFIKKFAPHKADIYFLGFTLLFILMVLRISLSVSRAVHDSMGLDIPLFAFYYAIPVGGAAMLVRFIVNSETALVFSVVTSIFAGIVAGNNLNYTGYCLISSIVAASSIAYADKRSSILRAGLYTGIVSAVAAIGIQLVSAGSLTEPLTFLNLVWCVLFAFVCGLACAVIVTLVTPVAESLFGYTTDIKLLELANLNHPLLRELVIRAPGTYHHSHLVGILAESAAETIGANPLLARVAAYYHDIGKIRKPLYFTENASDSESRYEKLSPNMSALIVASHVKEGIELAQQYKVPKRIADMIPQHHGTKMISFFYDLALKEAATTGAKVDEKDFRYQGPKPQTREAGLLLLADAAEAAVRSLKEKSPSRIRQTVENVINTSFTEAQLDECDLTLRNLHDIAKSFTKILMGIYHQRIEYPKETLESNNQ